ncbi:PREDICTED: F-box/kelch-repeat protein At5g49000-like [Camelina sativa]|uniref:F-box/kelch-repeat protein At5g49000-like n=1 Tax=Camelina sativa TaxID=90675 RepID=A0ABM0US63_CAMSA|nr:PREDICTED: F-box/kelch-repeat protein At5g49000-like [Camelina sativa]
MSHGIFIIGGLVDVKPTSEVSYFNCFQHKWYLLPPMKMARASPSAGLMLTDSDGCKIYVFGGLGDDVADSSNWAEVFDISTQNWDFFFVFTPKMLLNIQQSVLMIIKEEEEVYAVDEDGQNFSFSPKTIGVSLGHSCSAVPPAGRILWCLPDDLHWKEVKGLQQLRQWGFDITKLCTSPAGKIVIFSKPHPHSLELCSTEISISLVKGKRNRR